MWIFGYGSLVWKVDFPYTQKLIGFIKGYERRFWQASIDHRGTPEKPGRVVTLVPSSSPEARIWGAAYLLHPDHLESTLEHLDHREVMGYEKVPVEFHPIPNHPLNESPQMSPLGTSSEPFEVTMYYGSHQNPHFLGNAPLKQIADQIWSSRGPSGFNKEYLFNLCKAMRQIKEGLGNCPVVSEGDKAGILDDHLKELEVEVRKLEETEEQQQSNLNSG